MPLWRDLAEAREGGPSRRRGSPPSSRCSERC
jgi:hypothetical protein